MRDALVSRIRRESNLTQEEFAAFCDVSKSTVSALEQGGRIGEESQKKILLGCLKLLDKRGRLAATTKG